MKFFNHFFLVLSVMLISIGCNRVKDKTKEIINKGGETAGKTATEFFEGVTDGVDKTLQCSISMSQSLKDKGISTGTFSIQNDSLNGKNNVLSIYLIFDKDFNDEISAFVYDKNGAESGRTRMVVKGKGGDAGYFDFYFDKRTYIEVKSKIVLH